MCTSWLCFLGTNIEMFQIPVSFPGGSSASPGRLATLFAGGGTGMLTKRASLGAAAVWAEGLPAGWCIHAVATSPSGDRCRDTSTRHCRAPTTPSPVLTRTQALVCCISPFSLPLPIFFSLLPPPEKAGLSVSRYPAIHFTSKNAVTWCQSWDLAL